MKTSISSVWNNYHGIITFVEYLRNSYNEINIVVYKEAEGVALNKF